MKTLLDTGSCVSTCSKKERVGNDQEKAKSERDYYHSENRGGKETKLKIRVSGK